MNAEALLELQRDLRARLLDRPTIAWRPARDLAAHLLLHLDDSAFCLQFAVQWLRDALDADRVGAGFGSPREAIYRPQAEALRPTRDVPSMAQASIDATDTGVQSVWSSARVAVFGDVGQERSFGAGLRTSLLAFGSKNILATALWHRGAPVGLTCADWMELRVNASDRRCSRLQEVATLVLGPVLGAAASVQDVDLVGADRPNGRGSPASLLWSLTPAERRVAQLAATGMSYKEIARHLQRSFSTVDHQLRSIRTKLGVASTGRLVRILSAEQRYALVALAPSEAPDAANGS